LGLLVEKLLSAVSVVAVVATISAFSDWVNVPVIRALGDQPLARLTAASLSVQGMATSLTTTFTAFAAGNTWMVGYGLASLILLLLMLRPS
jgi:hypothetical protein